MHIPDSMLQNTLCTVTLVVGAASLVAAVHAARKAESRPSAVKFGAITALIFAAQMVNFPILSEVSGHLLGGVLAAALLGVPFGVLSVALVIAIQALLFGDGGIDALGANILNMAVLGAGVGGALYSVLRARWQRPVSMGIAAWVAVMLAAFVVSMELGMGGRVAFLDIAPAMLGVHALIGLGEALITVLAFELLSSTAVTGGQRAGGLVPLGLAAGLVMFSPFASALPDGLSWVAAQHGWLPTQAVSALAQAGMPGVLLGALFSLAAGWGVMRTLHIGSGMREDA